MYHYKSNWVLSAKDLKKSTWHSSTNCKTWHHVAEARRLERNPKSNLQRHQNQGENKIKKSKLAYWLNYKKATIL